MNSHSVLPPSGVLVKITTSMELLLGNDSDPASGASERSDKEEKSPILMPLGHRGFVLMMCKEQRCRVRMLSVPLFAQRQATNVTAEEAQKPQT